MTSREKSQQTGTAINATGGTDSRLAALRSLANRDKLRFNRWVCASAEFSQDPQDTRRRNGSGDPRGKYLPLKEVAMLRVGLILPAGFGVMSYATLATFDNANFIAGEQFYELSIHSEHGGPVLNSFGTVSFCALPRRTEPSSSPDSPKSRVVLALYWSSFSSGVPCETALSHSKNHPETEWFQGRGQSPGIQV